MMRQTFDARLRKLETTREVHAVRRVVRWLPPDSRPALPADMGVGDKPRQNIVYISAELSRLYPIG